MDTCLSVQEKSFIIDGVQHGIRNDGRGLSDYRPIFLETGVLSTTNGSARVQIDTTDVLVGVKAEMTAVEDSSKCDNRLKFYVDCSANATPKFAGKGGHEMGEELAKVFHSAYDNEEVLPDIKKLVLAPTFIWTINVDVVILQYGGNVLDAISLGVKAALGDTLICEVLIRPADEGKIMLDLPDENLTWGFDISRAPLVICVNKIGEQGVVDATEYEEACSTSALYVGVQPPGYEQENASVLDDDCFITCVRKSKGGSLEVESVEDMLGIAVRSARNLDKALTQRLLQERNVKESNPFLSLKTFLR